ncbi:MAG TPA: DUF1592 domain-containing protein [Sphingobium sp.]|uniref:DUF1592 domain-containing protein n=1 Tax=Sphingobium sp. TaxID=1912891 RepID=UPI002ED24A42
MRRKSINAYRTGIAVALCLGTGLSACSANKDQHFAAAPAAEWSDTARPTIDVAGFPIAGMRRLTEAQYRNAIGDIFGADIIVGGRFDPIVRPVHELVATGASQSTVSAAGFEQYDQMARDIAGQVFAPSRRRTFLGCLPADSAKADDRCARAFLQKIGLFVFRRPLAANEVNLYVAIAARGAAPVSDFYKGLELSLASMLVSPEFLYRIEAVAPGRRDLDSYTKASRLSFLIWNSIPDAALFAAAARGDLETSAGLKAQVERMLASPRIERGARAFFTDFLQFDRVGDVSKDTVVYPRFTVGVGADLREQALRTIVDLLITRNQGYPDLFSSRRTFLNRRLGLIYQVPVASPSSWEAYEYPASSDRVGLLGQGAFLALFSHEGRSSPTLRGRAIREVLLCQPVPDPPANVDFSGFNDTSSAVLRTARQRLDRHTTDPVCAACHKITDPLGLPLERYDGIGGLRNSENGDSINVHGSFEGNSLEGLAGLASAMAKSSSPAECVAKRAIEYATGQQADALPEEWMQRIFAAFQSQGSKYRSLLESIALSPEFFAVAKDALPQSMKVAALNADSKEKP